MRWPTISSVLIASLVICGSGTAPAALVFGTTSNSGPQTVVAADTATGHVSTVLTGFNQLIR